MCAILFITKMAYAKVSLNEYLLNGPKNDGLMRNSGVCYPDPLFTILQI